MYFYHGYAWLLLSCSFLEATSNDSETTNIYYDTTLEGFKLDAIVLKAKVVPEKIDCIMACAFEPCCRSINYKKNVAHHEINCEMLSDLLENDSKKFLKKNKSFDYAFKILANKKLCASCHDDLNNEVKAGHKNSTTCNETKIIKKGCYFDPGADRVNKRTLPVLLKIYPKQINWISGWNYFLHDVTCYCASLAKIAGYPYFGIQGYEECWAGNLSSKFFKSTSKSDKCWGARPNYENCIDSAETKCVGTRGYNYIYKIITD